MPVSDLDIQRTAHLWIQQHGESATAEARQMVEAMRRRGDAEGTDTWLRIIVASASRSLEGGALLTAGFATTDAADRQKNIQTDNHDPLNT